MKCFVTCVSILGSMLASVSYSDNKIGNKYVPGQRLTIINSVKNEGGTGVIGYGNTTQFWQIPYASRLLKKGVVSNSTSNFYNPLLYANSQVFQAGKVTTFIDEVWDLNNQKFEIMRATATGFNASTMRFQNPVLVSGYEGHFNAHFAGGWVSYDFEGDESPLQCNSVDQSTAVTQHIGYADGCGTTYIAGNPTDLGGNDGWGPRMTLTVIPPGANFASDGTFFTKLNRYRRSVIIPE
jgi:hypothetical protein